MEYWDFSDLRTQIKNREGRVIHEGDRSKQFCNLDLPNAVFEGLALEGSHFDDSNWDNFFLANLAEADLEGAQLRALT